jgi:hypothetical protein
VLLLVLFLVLLLVLLLVFLLVLVLEKCCTPKGEPFFKRLYVFLKCNPSE